MTRSGEVGRRISSLEEIKSLLNGVYGGRGRHGERGFDVHEGILFANLPLLERTKLMDEGTLQMYAEEYARSGLHQTRKCSLHIPHSVDSTQACRILL